MRRSRLAALALAGLLALGVAAGCGGSDDDDSSASEPATTELTETTAPTTEADTETAPPATTEAAQPVGPGDAQAGGQVFVATCQGCHADGGRQAGYGPLLAGQGLTEAQIRTVVVEGRPPMPAALVSGQDLEDVVAYVGSLQ